MRVKSPAIVVVAVGLMAGSAVGVAAQSEEADAMAPAVVTGTVTPLEVFPKGHAARPMASRSWRVSSMLTAGRRAILA